MSKSENKKKYRHGIQVKQAGKSKIKKEDLLRRIEVLEEKLNIFSTSKTDVGPEV